jgi:hypothetical protein
MNDLSNIPNLEAMMLAEPQVDCPVTHHFGPSLYIQGNLYSSRYLCSWSRS